LADSSLLVSKLFIPHVRPERVLRARLVELLNDGLQRKLTLVSAPAGFGKTTLLAQWIEQSPCCVTWLSLDEGDNDPLRFWLYLIEGVSRFNSEIAQSALALLRSERPPPVEAVLMTLMNNLANSSSDDFAIVLSDYHVIKARAIHEGMAFLLQYLPPRVHLVIATRADPPLPIARLRAHGHLVEIRAADLRFTREEATAFLNQAVGSNLTPEQIATLHSRTEGWIVGLELAALSMKGRGDLPVFLQSFSGNHSFVVDYLTEEVLRRQPERVQDFLLQTSILDRLSAPLCDAITQRNDGREMLEKLEREGLFIEPLDSRREWYRYHRLFADVLQTFLRNLQADQVPILNRRASQWFEREGQSQEAIQHALAVRDYERVADLIEKNASSMMRPDGHAGMTLSLEALPEEILQRRPMLSYLYAWTQITLGRLEAYQRPLQLAESAWRESGNHAKLGEALGIRASVAVLQGDAGRTVELAQKSLALLPATDSSRRGESMLALGAGYVQAGDVASAEKTLLEASTLCQSGESLAAQLYAMNLITDLRMIQGNLNEASALNDQVIQQAGERPHLQKATAYIWRGNLLRERNDLDAARRHMLLGTSMGEQIWQGWTMSWANADFARVLWSLGETEAAFTRLNRAETAGRNRGNRMNELRIQALRARFWLSASGNGLDAASEWGRRFLQQEAALSFEREFEWLTYARVLIAQAKPTGAQSFLAPLFQSDETAGRRHNMIEILVLQALAEQELGNVDKALDTLERAVSLAEPEGFARIFIDEGKPMGDLLRQMALHTSHVSYVVKLATALTEAAPSRLSPFANQSPAELLSIREQEVLRLMALGLTNQDIAEQLVVVVGTVKGHINNILRKLDAKNRIDAVSKARQLKLL
jgi:ATP/maltotriose-dependent transcriptional regulator MalT